MGCCQLVYEEKEDTVVCKSCGVKVRYEIYLYSGGCAEGTKLTCPQCGLRKIYTKRLDAEFLAKCERGC